MEKSNFNTSDCDNLREDYGEYNFNMSMNSEHINDQIYSDGLGSKTTSKDKSTNILSDKRNVLQTRPDYLKTDIKMASVEEEKDFCHACCEDLIYGEVISYCLCCKFYHPNCLILQMNKTRAGLSNKCEDCQSHYQFANYKQPNQMDSTLEKTIRTETNFSLIDTNINNLDNYNEMCGMAFHMSHEGIAEIINKKNDYTYNGLNSNEKEIGRIALSPITLSTTPYSGKTKGQINSNQKVEDYIRLQNTHTTPNNYRHINLSEVQNEEGNNYPQSPEVSFQGIRQHLSFYSPNANNTNNNIINLNNVNSSSNKNLNAQSAFNNAKTTEVSSFDIDKFFKSINFDMSSVAGMTSDVTNNPSSVCNNTLSYRKIVFDDMEIDENKENEDAEYNFDKENSPPLPRESSKYSYYDPEIVTSQSPLEVNLEAGISHIVSDMQKIVEIPISVDIKIKENFNFGSISNFSKDFILIFNTRSLDQENVFGIFKILLEKMSEGDRVFTNVLSLGKWLSQEDFKLLLQSQEFQNYLLLETEYLNYSEITKLVTYCIDLSFEYHSNIFSLIIVTDIDEISLDVDYLEEIKIVANKFKESRVNLIKNFMINCIVLDHCKFEDQKTEQNLRSISFFYDLSMLCLGYFFAPKDFNELYKSVFILTSLVEQSSLLNVKATIKGNKDPSVFIEVLNYPHVKKHHNSFDVYLGSLMKKEKKFLNLNAIVILNNPNVSMNLPLLEVNFEFMSSKHRETCNTVNNFNFNFNLMNNLNATQGKGNLIINKTPYYQLSLPIIFKNKEIFSSNSVLLRSCCSRIGDLFSEALDCVKSFNFDEALSKLYYSKNIFEQTLSNQRSLIKYFKLFSDLNNSYSINLNMNNVHFLNFTKMSNLNNNINNNNNMMNNSTTLNTVNYSLSNDDSLNDLVKNMNHSNISKIFSFCLLILTDINNLIEMIKNRNLNLITEFFTIKQSLMFYRPVHLNDDRFLDDVIE